MPEATSFAGKKVLVTGGSGSFGQAIVQELLRRKVSVVRVLDHDENGLWTLQEKHRGEDRLRLLLGNVRDLPRLTMACTEIDVVVHGAALKHVQSCEYNPFEAVRTNVLGTQNVINAALENNVEKVILTSTDKAANPTNVMGTTKLLAEKLIVAANYYTGRHITRFSCVRFGNVLGSRGSAPMLFRQQAEAGGPITLTDPRMTRFVMRLSEAVRLVLEATARARGGETFILKMDAVRIADIAAVMAARVGGAIRLQRTGMKPGEKLYEELMTEEEVPRSADLGSMFVLLPGMPELLAPAERAYAKARRARRVPYRSDRVRPLSRKAIAALLSAEGLL